MGIARILTAKMGMVRIPMVGEGKILTADGAKIPTAGGNFLNYWREG